MPRIVLSIELDIVILTSSQLKFVRAIITHVVPVPLHKHIFQNDKHKHY